MSPSTVSADSPRPAPKPLHPAVYGCIVLSVLALGLGGLAIYQASQKVREISEMMREIRGPQQPPGPERVRGAIVHRDVTPPDAAGVIAFAWRDDTHLACVDVPRPTRRQWLSATPRVPFLRRQDPETMRRAGERMKATLAKTVRPTHISEYDCTTRTRQPLIALPAGLTVACAGMAWNSDGTRLAVWLCRPGDSYVEPMGLYVADAGAKTKWTHLADFTSGRRAGVSLLWSPDDEYIGFAEKDMGNWSAIHYLPASGGEPRSVAGACSVYRWGASEAQRHSLYLVNGVDGAGGLTELTVTRVAVGDTAPRSIPVRDVGVKAGLLNEKEIPVTRPPKGYVRTLTTAVGALDYETGELRWVTKDASGFWLPFAETLGGKAILLCAVGQIAGETARNAIVSTATGHLTSVPGLDELPRQSWRAISPGGGRVAIEDGGRTSSFQSVSISDKVVVVDFAYPEELLGEDG